MADIQAGSVLAADFGSVNTRVVLIDLVDGEYRLVARGEGHTTVGYPVDDVSVGLSRVLSIISSATERKFYDDAGRIITPEQDDRSGVDYFLTTASAGRPMRAVLVGLMPDVSLVSALRAVAGAYVETVATLHLGDELDEEARLNAILLSYPDLIFISGGVEGGAQAALLEITEVVKLAISLIDPAQRPTVIYAGNSAAIEAMTDQFEGIVPILIAENIRPSMEKENLPSAARELGAAYTTYKDRQGSGFDIIAGMSNTGIQPTSGSYHVITEYYTRSRKQNVIAVDFGSGTSIISAGFNKLVDTSINPNLGLGHSAKRLVEVVGEEAIANWLPYVPRPGEIVHYALNKSLRPATIPMNLRELYMEHAFLRAGIQTLMQIARPTWRGVEARGALPDIGLVIGAGSALTHTGHPGFNTMLMLDAIQPEGITEIKADPHALIPALGALSSANPNAVVQLLDGKNLEHLGVVINVSGKPTPGKRAIKLKVRTEDGEEFDEEVMGNVIWALPLPATHSLEIEMQLSRGLTIGGKSKLTVTLSGGSAGLIFDTRGRPLPLASTPQERAIQLPQWLHEITGNPLQEIPPRWLREDEAVPDEDEAAALPQVQQAKPRKKGGGLFGFLRRGKKQDDAAAADPLDRLEEDDDLLDFDAMPDDDDFADFLDDDETDAKTAKKRKEDEKLDEELGSLRDLL